MLVVDFYNSITALLYLSISELFFLIDSNKD